MMIIKCKINRNPWGSIVADLLNPFWIVTSNYIDRSAKILPVTSILDEKRRATSIHNRFHEIVDHDRIMGNLLTYRENPLFATAYKEGEKLSQDEAIALALA